ncbi:MAG TPA: 6-phosphogluconolactonase [Thermoanaerobaculia bacterium]|nr:6-phosphogluconolactonase [Thermoanaerobaculia bacterium]
MNLRIFDSVDELIRGAARTIVERAADGTSIALSGGSTPKPLYELLGRNADLRERRVTWVVVDERYVPMTDPQSNAAMIERTLFANGIPPHHRFLRFKTELNDPAATAREFEREWRELALTDLDIVILGMGDDGHTASLFPNTPALAVEDRLATEVFVDKLDMWRVTITKPVIRAAKLRMVLAAGASKRETLKQIRDGADYPIAHVTSGVETWWFVDRAAAG